ncbi:MAG: hypothetical protein R3F24_04435 [Gammaproteobacteria bacterium]
MNPTLKWLSQWLGTALVLAIAGVTLTQDLPAPQSRADRTTGPIAGPGTAEDLNLPCTLEPTGFLRGQIFGAVTVAADWTGDGLYCNGMARPDGRGVRLFFAHELAGSGRLSIQISIDGPPDKLAGHETPANVTIIDPSGRFFSSGGFGRCWTRIDDVRQQHGASELRIDGIVYCVGALPAIRDAASLTLGDLQFAGRVIVDAT